MIVVDIHPDGFKQAAAQQRDGGAAGSRVRRPTRGIVLKEDTFATIKVVTSSGGIQNLVDAGSRARNESNQPLEIAGKRATSAYSNFLIQQVNEERAEKAQILETFGEPYIFLFGERARVITVNGILANTWDFNWEAEWWHNYENYLRGTKCVENDAMVFLQFDDSLIGGYIIGSNSAKTAQERNYVQFSFQMFVTFQTNLSQIGVANAAPPEAVKASGAFQFEKGSTEFSADDLAPMRPPLLPPTQYASQWKTDGTSIEQPEFFASVMQFAVNPVKKAWTLANNAVSRVTSALNTFLSTGVVEVPYGFAGTMEFDEDWMLTKIHEAKVGGSVTYSTFADNEDEYVDPSNHYGSSDPTLFKTEVSDPSKFGGTLGRLSYPEEIRRGLVLNRAAENIWNNKGRSVDLDAHGVFGTNFNGSAKAGWGLVQISGITGVNNLRVREKTGLQFKSMGYGRLLNGVGAQIQSGPKLPWG